jgi:hypothetical protein
MASSEAVSSVAPLFGMTIRFRRQSHSRNNSYSATPVVAGHDCIESDRIEAFRVILTLGA